MWHKPVPRLTTVPRLSAPLFMMIVARIFLPKRLCCMRAVSALKRWWLSMANWSWSVLPDTGNCITRAFNCDKTYTVNYISKGLVIVIVTGYGKGERDGYLCRELPGACRLFRLAYQHSESCIRCLLLALLFIAGTHRRKPATSQLSLICKARRRDRDKDNTYKIKQDRSREVHGIYKWEHAPTHTHTIWNQCSIITVFCFCLQIYKYSIQCWAV